MDSDATSTLPAGRCPACGRAAHPLRFACRVCATPLAPERLAGSGTLQAWTTIHTPPAGFEAPYTIAYVTLDDGPRVLVRLDPPVRNLRIGAAVTVLVEDDERVCLDDALVGRVATRTPS